MEKTTHMRCLETLVVALGILCPITSVADPAPASPPSSMSSDPAPANPPPTTTSMGDRMVPLIDMASLDSALPADPPPASPPGGAIAPMSAVIPAKNSSGVFLGVGFRNPDKPIVTTLYAGSTAALLGIRLGDTLSTINGSKVGSIYELRKALFAFAVGDEVTVNVIRAGEPMTLGPKPLGAKL